MRIGFKSDNWDDVDGNPAGGTTFGTGFTIGWQRGPLGRESLRIEPNGAFVEDVIDACIDRLLYYQNSKFNCSENAEAISFLKSALTRLDERTKDREKRRVEGTHKQ